MSNPSSEFELAKRPGFGSKGSIFEVLVNTFEIRSYPKVPFLHYDVILPTPKGSRQSHRIIQRLQHYTAPNVFSQVVTVFDGVKNLYAVQRPLFEQGAMTFTVNMSDDPKTTDSRKVYNVTVTSVAEIVPRDLMHVLQGHEAAVPITTTPLQVLNVLLQQAAELRFPVQKKQKYFDSTGHSSIGGLEIWRGYFASLRPTIGKLLLNVDMATGVMYQRGPLIDFVLTFGRFRDYRILNDFREDHPEWTRMQRVLKKLQIKESVKKRLRTISTIVPHAGTVDFTMSDGTSTTVEDYYREKYGVVLKHPRMPGIKSARGEVIPFELCEIKEGQSFTKKAAPEIMAAMLNFSKKRPDERLNIIRNGMQRLQLDNSPYISQSGITISPQPMEICGRLLDPPPMVYGEGLKEKPRAGSWNMVNRKLVDPMPIRTWAVVSFDSAQNAPLEVVRKFVSDLARAMVAVGMGIASRPAIIYASPYHPEKELKGVCDEAVRNTKHLPTLLIIILPQNTAPLRKAVKQFGDIRHGIVTQCVRTDKMLKANNQYHNNLILKINAKLGGTNTTPSTDSPSFSWFSSGKAMVVGADVTHPGPGVLRPSVASCVFSVDEKATKYVSRCSVQAPRAEIIEGLGELMLYGLKMFYAYRKHLSERLKRNDVPLLPERIVFYRDGVSEGEIHKVARHEIMQIMKAIESVYTEKGAPFRATLTFIVVGKRHHVRFIPKQGRGADKSGNAPAGLLVDQGITAPRIFDFYLQSHAGLLGTSRPSHYIVVKDDNNFPVDILQGFSFDLCHTYARSTRSVSIPAPVYYADIACARADFHFNPILNFEDDLSSTEGEFDLQPWIKGFSNVHPNQETNMYFM